MIQIHGNTIFPKQFNPMIKAHDSNLWQIIHQKAQFLLAISKSQFSLAISKAQSPLAISKAQFPLAISKAQFSLALFYKKAQDYLRLAEKQYYGIIIA